jgi:putative ABC transport system ATP-binding protein
MKWQESAGFDLKLSSACRTYGSETPVLALKNCNLQVRSGDFVAVIGRSGSGKSTLLNVLGLLDSLSSGSYEINNIETSTLSDKERTFMRSRLFSFIFQRFHLLTDRTVTENVELPLLYQGLQKRERAIRSQKALELVGLENRANVLPATLSGGEAQRVAIARALTQKSPILLCDEPTGNLDYENGISVMAQLSNLNEAGLTVVIVTHDMEIANGCRTAFRVNDGVVTSIALDVPASSLSTFVDE